MMEYFAYIHDKNHSDYESYKDILIRVTEIGSGQFYWPEMNVTFLHHQLLIVSEADD